MRGRGELDFLTLRALDHEGRTGRCAVQRLVPPQLRGHAGHDRECRRSSAGRSMDASEARAATAWRRFFDRARAACCRGPRNIRDAHRPPERPECRHPSAISNSRCRSPDRDNTCGCRGTRRKGDRRAPGCRPPAPSSAGSRSLHRLSTMPPRGARRPARDRHDLQPAPALSAGAPRNHAARESRRRRPEALEPGLSPSWRSASRHPNTTR